MNKGLREQLLAAESVAELDNLFASGRNYKYASNDTRRGWKRAANRRYAEIKKGE